jgi:UDP-N-acetylmuramate dehydrogenase
MIFQKNVNLSSYTTFRIDAHAEFFAAFSDTEQLISLLSEIKNSSITILGGGSNMLLTKDITGYVLRNEIVGITIEEETPETVLLKVGGGVVWHDFVMYTIENNYFGLENLSLIPGSVGASPMQNIGAYGIEIKDCFEKLDALEIQTKTVHSFNHEKCEFGYRESVFKRKLKGQYIITYVYFRLHKNGSLNTSYGAINAELTSRGITIPTIKEVSEAVISIRKSKLPDPKELGNAGSFFKNPVVPVSVFESIKSNFPKVPSYFVNEENVKIPAGWLIETAGWKGKRIGNCGVHTKQALVIVNYGSATGKEVFELSQAIIDDIYNKFSIQLEREVNIY